MTEARRARVTSAAIRLRSAAAVESRSSQNMIGQRRQPREIAREGARSIAPASLAAIHVDRQSEHEADRLPFVRELDQNRAASAVKALRATSRPRSRAGGPDRWSQPRSSWCRDRGRSASRAPAAKSDRSVGVVAARPCSRSAGQGGERAGAYDQNKTARASTGGFGI